MPTLVKRAGHHASFKREFASNMPIAENHSHLLYIVVLTRFNGVIEFASRYRLSSFTCRYWSQKVGGKRQALTLGGSAMPFWIAFTKLVYFKG
jgi:hypothetical protein